MTISFKVSIEVSKAIADVVKKYEPIYKESTGRKIDTLSLMMDLTAAHANGCPMDWERLLKADKFTFVHDVSGIQKHLNRQTGVIENCFVPRCHAR